MRIRLGLGTTSTEEGPIKCYHLTNEYCLVHVQKRSIAAMNMLEHWI